MNKDEIQQTKALIKLKCIKKVIDILQDLNLLKNERDMKQYNIILDYKKENDFTTFIVKFNTQQFNGYSMPICKTIFEFDFKLKDENTGFAIYKNIREYFVKKNDLQYPSFQKNPNFPLDNLEYSMHHIKTNHHMDLFSIIHSKKDEEKLKKFNEIICNKYKKYIKKIHTVNSDKDEIQLSKAKKKQELTYIVIDMLNELSATDNFKYKSYEILLDYLKLDDFYEFKIQLFKNNNTVPLNINFKLKNKEEGLEIFNDIVKYYLQQTEVVYGTYNNLSSEYEKTDYRIVSKNNININYRIPKEIFNKTVSDFTSIIKEKQNLKKLEKVK